MDIHLLLGGEAGITSPRHRGDVVEVRIGQAPKPSFWSGGHKVANRGRTLVEATLTSCCHECAIMLTGRGVLQLEATRKRSHKAKATAEGPSRWQAWSTDWERDRDRGSHGRW